MQRLGEPARAGVIFGQPLDVVLERVETCGGDDPSLSHRASHQVLAAARVPGELRGRCEQRAERAAEALRETQRHGVEPPAVIGRRDARRDRRVHEPCAVEVQLQVELARGRDDVVDLVHPPAAPPRRVVCVLDGDESRASHVHRRAVTHERAHGVAVVAPGLRAYWSCDEPGVDGGAALLGEEDVRILFGEQLVAGLGQDPARDLVGHARRREVDRLILTEELRRAPLELEHGRVLALLLVAYLGIRHRLTHGTRRLRCGIGAEIDHPRESSGCPESLCNLTVT